MKIFFFYLSFKLLVFKILTFQFPNSVNGIFNSNIMQICKQIQYTSSRVICLSPPGQLIAYNFDGTGFTASNLFVSFIDDPISYFQVPLNSDSIFFYVNNSSYYVFELDHRFVSTLTNKSLISLNTGFPSLSGALKVNDNLMLVTVPRTQTTIGWAAQNYLYKYNLTSSSLIGSYILALAGDTIYMKLSPNSKSILIWDLSGKTHVYYVEREEFETQLSELPQETPPTYFRMQYDDMTFSPDGTHLAVSIKAIKQIFFYRETLVNGVMYWRKYATGSYYSPIKSFGFWSTNNVIAVLNSTFISFYDLTTPTWTLMREINYGLNLQTTKIIPTHQLLVFNDPNYFFYIQLFLCPSGYYFFDINPLYCYDSNPTNVTLINTTNVTNSNVTIPPGNDINTSNIVFNNVTYENQEVATALNFITQILLQTKTTESLNRVPAARRILKPIFTFFSNFDDIQLYNYLNINFSSIHQDVFNQIQQLEQEKWNLIHFNQIWYNSFGVNLNPLQQFLNDTLRVQYTSKRFLKLEGSADGYILNTLQFYLSNFILTLTVFSLGYLLFYVLKHFRIDLYTWFTQFKVWIVFPIFLSDGNIPYMTYLIGFQFKNLWFTDFSRKYCSFFIIFGFSIFLIGMSMIYFFIKYFQRSSTKQFFEVCRPSIKGIFYMNFIFGIKNFLFGLAHQMFDQSLDFICKKLALLIFIEVLCLILSLHLSRGKFFISKSRRWIFMFTSLIRTFIAFSYILNVWTRNENEIVQARVSDAEIMLMIIFILFWPIMVFMDLFQIFQMVWVKIAKKCKVKSVVENKKLRFAENNDKTFKNIGEERHKILKVSMEKNHVDFVGTKKSNMDSAKQRLHFQQSKRVIQTLQNFILPSEHVCETNDENEEKKIEKEGNEVHSRMDSGTSLMGNSGTQNKPKSLHYMECRYVTGVSEEDEERGGTILLRDEEIAMKD